MIQCLTHNDDEGAYRAAVEASTAAELSKNAMDESRAAIAVIRTIMLSHPTEQIIQYYQSALAANNAADVIFERASDALTRAIALDARTGNAANENPFEYIFGPVQSPRLRF